MRTSITVRPLLPLLLAAFLSTLLAGCGNGAIDGISTGASATDTTIVGGTATTGSGTPTTSDPSTATSTTTTGSTTTSSGTTVTADTTTTGGTTTTSVDTTTSSTVSTTSTQCATTGLAPVDLSGRCRAVPLTMGALEAING